MPITDQKVELIHDIERAIHGYEDGLPYNVIEDICVKFLQCYMFPVIEKFSNGLTPEIEFSYAPPTDRELAGREAYYIPEDNKIIMTIRAVSKKAQTQAGVMTGTYYNSQCVYRAIQSMTHEYEHFIQDILATYVKQEIKVPKEFSSVFVVNHNELVEDFNKPNKTEEESFEEIKKLAEKHSELRELINKVHGRNFDEKILELVYIYYFCRLDEVDARLVSISKLAELESDFKECGLVDNYSTKHLEYYNQFIATKEHLAYESYKSVYEEFVEVMRKINGKGTMGE